MTVAGQWVGAAAGFNQDVRPDKPGFDMDGGHLGNADADFILAEPGPFMSDDGLVGNLDDGGKEMIAAGPAAGFEFLRLHADKISQWPRRATGF